jgi:hypothetical protein
VTRPPTSPALLLATLFACAETDLGAPCHLLRRDGTEASPIAGHHVVQSGSGECDRFVCVSFDGAPPACSRPCEREGEACEEGQLCRAALLVPDELETLRLRTEGKDQDGDGVDDFEQLAAGLSESLSCGPPPL